MSRARVHWCAHTYTHTHTRQFAGGGLMHVYVWLWFTCFVRTRAREAFVNSRNVTHRCRRCCCYCCCCCCCCFCNFCWLCCWCANQSQLSHSLLPSCRCCLVVIPLTGVCTYARVPFVGRSSCPRIHPSYALTNGQVRWRDGDALSQHQRPSALSSAHHTMSKQAPRGTWLCRAVPCRAVPCRAVPW